ncbi:MAG: ribosome silencing factor [Anaerovorax sp.]
MNSRELAIKGSKILEEKKANDIILVDITQKSSFADYLVIATGGSERQVGTLSEEIDDQFSKEGIHAKSIEGKKNSGWILMDFGDVIVNIFSAEQRDRYQIEKIWNDCEFIDFQAE